MKIKKNISGFTLIETIVVAVIIAIIATVATILYGGYITESRQQTVNALADAASASANAWVRKTGTNLTAADSAKLNLHFPDPTKFTVTIDPAARTVQIGYQEYANISQTRNY